VKSPLRGFARKVLLPASLQSGDAACHWLADEPLDVVVSDIRMKTPFDGLALLDHVPPTISAPAGGSDDRVWISRHSCPRG